MEKDFIILRGAVSQEICKFTSIEFKLMEDGYKKMYPGHNPADMCANSFARYAPLPFETLSVYLLPTLEQTLNLRLYPTYSYARIYYNGSELTKHKDRSSSEITVSVCIEKDAKDWPLYIETDNGIKNEIFLNTGDIVIYSGRKYAHWRNPFTGTSQVQAFLQYVDADGDSSWLKWDTRPALGLPFEYANVTVQEELKRIASERD